jgi:hypothetical protein
MLVHILEICTFLLYIIILFLLFDSNRKLHKFNSQFQGILLDDLTRLSMIQSFLMLQCNNPLILEACNRIRVLENKDLPRNERDFYIFYQGVAKDFHEKIWSAFQERIKQAETAEEKVFFETRCKKVSQVIDLLSTIDENSSLDFLKLIIIDVQKALPEMFL